jgi:hypothetical protein
VLEGPACGACGEALRFFSAIVGRVGGGEGGGLVDEGGAVGDEGGAIVVSMMEGRK